MEIDVITLEDNKEYGIFDTLEHENNKYLFLGNLQDESDVCMRKIIVKDGKEYLRKLEDEEEFENIMTLYYEKHIGKEEEKDEE